MGQQTKFCLIFNKNVIAIHENKSVLTLDKSIYVGFSILDLSKYLMYEFHYKYIKRKYDAKLLFTDAEVLAYEIKTEHVYKDFFEDKSLFEFSDYPQDANRFDTVNKKVIGKMKNEREGKIIGEFVGLKSKMYSLIAVDDEETTKAKEVNKYVVKKIKHKEYINDLLNKKMIRHKMKKVQSKLYRIGTYSVCKVSLSCFDDKRYMLGHDINSLAYFHKDIRS